MVVAAGRLLAHLYELHKRLATQMSIALIMYEETLRGVPHIHNLVHLLHLKRANCLQLIVQKLNLGLQYDQHHLLTTSKPHDLLAEVARVQHPEEVHVYEVQPAVGRKKQNIEAELQNCCWVGT